jgi:transcriptional regulator with XRE-family HTH domain
MSEKDRGSQIRERIRQILEERNETQTVLAKKMGVGTGHLSKILSGADGRALRLWHLEKIAAALEVPVATFFEESYRVPVVGEVTLEGGPRHAALGETEVEEYIELFSKDPKMNCYALKVSDRSMLPVFKPGTKLVAEKDSWETLENNDYVVYLGTDGTVQLRQILLFDEIIILKGVNPSLPELSVPKAHLKLCDKIVQITLA